MRIRRLIVDVEEELVDATNARENEEQEQEQEEGEGGGGGRSTTERWWPNNWRYYNPIEGYGRYKTVKYQVKKEEVSREEGPNLEMKRNGRRNVNEQVF